MSNSAPPPSISMPVVSNPDSGSSASRDQNDPIAHDNDPRINTNAPSGRTSPRPPRFDGPTSTMIPMKPSISPKSTAPCGRSRGGRTHSMITSQKGRIETRSAVSPDGTNCSAHTTAPFPPSSKKAPAMTAFRQWSRVGLGAPRNRAHR